MVLLHAFSSWKFKLEIEPLKRQKYWYWLWKGITVERKLRCWYCKQGKDIGKIIEHRRQFKPISQFEFDCNRCCQQNIELTIWKTSIGSTGREKLYIAPEPIAKSHWPWIVYTEKTYFFTASWFGHCWANDSICFKAKIEKWFLWDTLLVIGWHFWQRHQVLIV